MVDPVFPANYWKSPGYHSHIMTNALLDVNLAGTARKSGPRRIENGRQKAGYP